MPDIVITEFMDQTAVDGLSAGFDVHYSPKLVDNPEELHQLLADARAIVVRNRTQVREALLDKAPKLQVVGRLGVGLDNIDMEACRKRGITVYPATGANDVAVAEYVIAAAMFLARNAYAVTQDVIAGNWPRQACIGREIQGLVMGLVGCGGIARETAQRASALGMRTIAYDPFVDAGDAIWSAIGRADDIDALLAESDVISLHVPLTDDTRNLIGADELSRTKPGAVIINTARGGVIDERALIAAMRDGRIGGAALDVFADEPVSAQSGKLFADVPNLLLTPHIAGVTEQSNTRVSALIADKVAKHLGAAQ